jgi:hypothetical protein
MKACQNCGDDATFCLCKYDPRDLPRDLPLGPMSDEAREILGLDAPRTEEV